MDYSDGGYHSMERGVRGLRRERVEKELAAAEVEFQGKLVKALKECAAGYWGLFAKNDHVDGPKYFADQAYESSGAKDLLALGREIEEFRGRLGIMEPYPLLARLIELRGRKTENDLGEPRLAQAWLKELGE